MQFPSQFNPLQILKYSGQRLSRMLVLPITQGYRKLIRIVNPNGFSAKVMTDVKKGSKELLTTKEPSLQNYFDIGNHYISKKLVLILALLTLVLPILYLQYLHPVVQTYWLTTNLVINTGEMMGHTGKVRLRAYEDGSVLYLGNMAFGRITGDGTLYDYDGNLVYTGAFENEKYSGTGLLYHDNGILQYSGTFQSNLYSGDGLLYFTNGTLEYQGTFSKGLYDGAGIQYDQQGQTVYDGAFSKGLYEGAGLLYQNGALLYRGDFVAGNMEGQGVVYSGDQITYEGSFAVGGYDGAGKLYDVVTGNLLYDGTFDSGTYSGEGRLFDGQSGNLRYVGGFYQGVFEGAGKLYDPDTGYLLYEGSFRQGFFDGEGVLYDLDSGKVLFQGNFLLGQAHGSGTLYDPDTGFVVQSGNYENGVVVSADTTTTTITTTPSTTETVVETPEIEVVEVPEPEVVEPTTETVIPADATEAMPPEQPEIVISQQVYDGPTNQSGDMDLNALTQLPTEELEATFQTHTASWDLDGGSVAVYEDVSSGVGITLRKNTSGNVISMDVWNDAPLADGLTVGMTASQMAQLVGSPISTTTETMGAQRMISVSQSNRYFGRLTNLSPDSKVTIQTYETTSGTVQAIFMTGSDQCLLLEWIP
ncbi:MAG: hypothetical protein R3Y62_01645 [Eubacteriales bacterium]